MFIVLMTYFIKLTMVVVNIDESVIKYYIDNKCSGDVLNNAFS